MNAAPPSSVGLTRRRVTSTTSASRPGSSAARPGPGRNTKCRETASPPKKLRGLSAVQEELLTRPQVPRQIIIPHASILMRRACCSDRMVDLGFPELLTLVQTIAIIAAIVIAVYFSRLQIQALKTDTEARVVNDPHEKLPRLGEIFMEKPEFVRILNDDAAVSNFGAEVAFAFYVMFFCSHCYHMRERGILSDNDWAGWLQWTKNAFRSGRLGKYWKEAEMQAWVDPAFREFVNREILGSS